MGGIWSEVKHAVSDFGGGAGEASADNAASAGSSTDLGWKGLMSDAQSAAKGALGDVSNSSGNCTLASPKSWIVAYDMEHTVYTCIASSWFRGKGTYLRRFWCSDWSMCCFVLHVLSGRSCLR